MAPITINTPLEVVADGLIFTEDPRWFNGKLYFSDTTAGRVYTLDPAGKLDLMVELDDHCSGLGFMPNGDLLIVSAVQRKLMRYGSGRLTEHADLSALTPQAINDMAVDRTGRAYVGDMRFNPAKPLEPQACKMFLVFPDGKIETAAENLLMGNGTVLTDDGGTLIVAETLGSRLTEFDRGTDGRLHNRRVFAQLPEGYFPDGIGLDSAGGIWAACPSKQSVVRVERGGNITHVVPMRAGYEAYACVLGGADRRTLYICTAETHDQSRLQILRSSKIERVAVNFAGTGVP